MDNKQVKIKDVITTEYGDFLSYCETSGKVFIEELTNVDFIAFRTISGQSREYIQTIKKKLEEMQVPPQISDTVSKVDSEKNPQNDTTNIPLADIFNIDIALFNDVKIESLLLCNRSFNQLKRAGFDTVADILKISEYDLMSIKNIGKKAVDDIVEKLKNFISNKDYFNVKTDLQSVNNEENGFEDIGFRVVEALLYEDKRFLENSSEKQSEIFEKVKLAIETVGKDICIEAYEKPRYMTSICTSLIKFAQPYMEYREYAEIVRQRLSLIPENIRERKLKPFIYAYLVSTRQKIPRFFLNVSDELVINDIPKLYSNIDKDKKILDRTKLVYKFLEWLNFDYDTIFRTTMDSCFDELKKNERYLDILKSRLQGNTLVEIGAFYNLTRERVRQIFMNSCKLLDRLYKSKKYDLIMILYAMKDGYKFINLNDLRCVMEDLADIFWSYLKNVPNNKNYFYSKKFDLIVVKEDENDNMNEELLCQNFFESLPDIIQVDDENDWLIELSQKNSVPLELLKIEFEKKYHKAGIVYHRNRLTLSYMCEYVLKHRFQSGYKIGDDFEAERFRKYMKEFFGENAGSMTNRALDAKISIIGVLCERGRYIHPDFLQVNEEIIKAVNDYVKNSEREVLTYKEVFDFLNDLFVGTQITNRYILQGALKKYGCPFKTDRDFIKKSNSVTYIDELENFVEERGIVHKSEIFAEFSSLNEASLGQVVARCGAVFNIDGGYYIHISQFDIHPEDYSLIRSYLKEACSTIPIHILSVQEDIERKFPEFMYRNEFDNKNKLFAALNYMFREEFAFSRPYIAKLGTSDITHKNVILQHIKDYDSIDVEELIDICEENKINYISLSYICNKLLPEYIRISKTTLMKYELTDINDEIIDSTVDIINNMLQSAGYIVGKKITDYLWFPDIGIEWNEFLLESVVVCSGRVNVINLTCDPLIHTNAVYVSDKFKNETFDSFLVKILKQEVEKGTFVSKSEMREWLNEEGLIGRDLPKFLANSKYFYADETGVHCVGE